MNQRFVVHQVPGEALEGYFNGDRIRVPAPWGGTQEIYMPIATPFVQVTGSRVRLVGVYQHPTYSGGYDGKERCYMHYHVIWEREVDIPE